MKVALFAKLIPRPARALRDIARLLQVVPHPRQAVVEVLVRVVQVRHGTEGVFVQLPRRLQLVPLRFKLFQRRGHPGADEEVPHEVVHHL
eukprot:31210-Pelagococcus_subviridis.AAC.11